MPGNRIGKYQLVAEIARGGMGIVYLALAQGPARFNKLHVVKELKPELVEDKAFVEMFLEEARLAARLNHPNIVQTHEVGSEDGRFIIVMDYLEGASLSRFVAKAGSDFTIPLKLHVVVELLRALHYAHTLVDLDGTPMHLVHRDATPQNVFVTYDGQVKLMDFGIAKALDSTLQTQAGVLKGKPGYMAPEQIKGKVDGRADLYSVGVILWELLANKRMWHRRGEVEVLTAMLRGEIPKLDEAAPETPAELVKIVERATAKDVAVRFKDAGEFAEAIEEYIRTSGEEASSRDLARVVSKRFEDERKKSQLAIEQHIQRAMAGEESSRSIPSMPPPSSATLTPTPGSRSRRDSLTSHPSSPSSTGTPAGAEIPIALEPPPSPAWTPRGWQLVGFGVVAIALLAIGLSMRSSATESASTAPPAASALPVPAAAPAAPAPTATTHRIVVHASPAAAAISFDGVVTKNPGERSCHSGDRFLVRITAPGYIARDREILCDHDEQLEIALAQGASPPVQVAAPWPPPKRADPAPEAAPAPAPKPAPSPANTPAKTAVPLDTVNPWH